MTWKLGILEVASMVVTWWIVFLCAVHHYDKVLLYSVVNQSKCKLDFVNGQFIVLISP